MNKRFGLRRNTTIALLAMAMLFSVGIGRASADHDVEHRIAQFWQRVDALGPGDYLSARDVGQWALNVIERNARTRITVADFRASAAGLQAAFDRAGPAPVAAPAPAPTPAPAPGAFTFGDGMYQIGPALPSGTYRTRTAPVSTCYWERLSGASGQSSDIKSNELTSAASIVTILAADAYFRTSRCGTWTSDLSAITPGPSAPFGNGHYIVGTDVGPGTWQSSATSGSCYWERQSAFTGEMGTIIANGLVSGQTFVTIVSTDRGFKTRGCGTWTKTG